MVSLNNNPDDIQVTGAGGPWDNLTGFLKFHFTNLSRGLNDLVKDEVSETL